MMVNINKDLNVNNVALDVKFAKKNLIIVQAVILEIKELCNLQNVAAELDTMNLGMI